MRNYIVVIVLIFISQLVLAQTEPGLHIDENQTVLFGKDTTTTGIKLVWFPGKASLRAGKSNVGEWQYDDLGVFTAAFGVDTDARGNYSFAAGRSTWAHSFAESSFGQFSLGGGDQTAWTLTDPLFEVGNGLGTSSRANAFTIFKNGNAEFQKSILVGDHAGTILNDGTIRYNGSDFQGRVNGAWQSLTSGGGSGGSSPWSTSGSNIFYNAGDIGVGTSLPTDNIHIRGYNALAEDVGISFTNSFSLLGSTFVKTGRIYQTQNGLNLSTLNGDAVISLYDDGMSLNSPTIFTKWGAEFRHSEGNFAQDYKSQAWLKKGWSGVTGDYLYLGSTGNRDVTEQHAMLLTQSDGIQFGRGMDDGLGLTSNVVKLKINTSVNSLESTTALNIFALNEEISFYRYGEAGGVTIGTGNLPTGYRLAVDGKIASEEVLVQLSGNWPDYVFEEDYELLELTDLESYIDENNHLPGIPSAEVVEENGIEVGEMQKMQMEKIEELTLYIIELKRQLDDLKLKVDSK